VLRHWPGWKEVYQEEEVLDSPPVRLGGGWWGGRIAFGHFTIGGLLGGHSMAFLK